MRALIALVLLGHLAAPATANGEEAKKAKIVIPPGVHDATITLQFDDSVIHPKPPVAPLTVVIAPPAVALDAKIFLIEPPVAHPTLVAAVIQVPEGPDAALVEAGALALLGFSALVLARRRPTHAVGTLAL